jgi:cytolysin-activating lysine-acyltransferase
MDEVTTDSPVPDSTPQVEHNSELSTDMRQKLSEIRSYVQETFGKLVLSLLPLPRYRNLGIGDLQPLILEPLLRDRIAIALVGEQDTGQDMAGFAIWASVSEEANTRLLEQVRAGVFPVRLQPEDWNSGQINWLLDVVAPNQKVATSVIANFNKVVKGGALHLHPMVSRLVDPDVLAKMGAEKKSAETIGDLAESPTS